ncbi:MAG: glucose-6-phosphate isomerase, partial [Chloroflexi bacterium]|nr:glucose-6-phosphate isomerase [Chloroflexota bacterium]
VTGAILGVNPFDQPDVQKTKTATERLLRDFTAQGQAPHVGSAGSPGDLLSKAGEGKYLSIMVYIQQTPELDRAFANLRRKVMAKYRMATTLGYGPRFLHSTGQLHKGGPNTGLFLQLTAAREKDLPVPGSPYSLGMIADAQALGDFEALQAAGRQVARIHSPTDDPASIARLIDGLI